MRTFLILLCLAFANSAPAADHGDVSYQGLPADISGNPVVDGPYNIVFTIWDDSVAGSQLWSQTMTAQTNSGVFTVVLNHPFDYLFEEEGFPRSGAFFMQTQIVGDPPMTPCSRLTAVYSSILSHRMEGDVFTFPGGMQIFPPKEVPPQPITPSILMSVDSSEAGMTIVNKRPEAEDSTAIAITSGPVRSSISIFGGNPPDDGQPQINMVADTGGTSFWLGSVDGAGAESLPVMSVETNGEINLNIGFGGPPIEGSNPPDDNKPGVNMNANTATSSFTLHGPDPGAAVFNGIFMTADVSEARMGINNDAPTSALYVDGDIVATGAITELSDGELKTNVREIENALEIISELRGVQFEWVQGAEGLSELPPGTRTGLIAQEVEKVLPEAVLSPEAGYKSVDYARFTPILIEAMKEQQKQIDELKKMVSQLMSATQSKVTVSKK